MVRSTEAFRQFTAKTTTHCTVATHRLAWYFTLYRLIHMLVSRIAVGWPDQTLEIVGSHRSFRWICPPSRRIRHQSKIYRRAIFDPPQDTEAKNRSLWYRLSNIIRTPNGRCKYHTCFLSHVFDINAFAQVALLYTHLLSSSLGNFRYQ
jgi:hypothetical protein